jgi:hypothetical protein
MGSRAKQFPSWAPLLLVEDHQRLLAELAQLTAADRAELAKLRRESKVVRFLTVEERLKLNEALIVNQNMKDVWASLDRRRAEFDRRLPKFAQFPYPPIRHGGTPEDIAVVARIQAKQDAAEAAWRCPAVRLSNVCASAYLFFDDIPRFNTSFMKARFRQIAEHSEALADLLPGTYWWGVPRSIAEQLYFLEPKSVSKFESMADMLGLKADSVLRNFFTGPPAEFLDRETDPWSNLSDFLKRLAELARKLAKSPPKMMAQSNSPDAKLRHFQIELSQYFMNAYGQPLHKQVADIASAVFSVSLSAENVRKLIKYRCRHADPEKTTG